MATYVALKASCLAQAKPATACRRPRPSRLQRLITTSAQAADDSCRNPVGAAVAAAVLILGAAAPDALAHVTAAQMGQLSYKEVKGSGLANTCPILEGGTPGSITDVAPGQYQIERFCMEPTSFKVKEESQFKGGDAEFVPTKLLTRMTYTLDQMSGKLTVGSKGEIALSREEDGLDYAAVTVKLPGGEEAPFLFSIKNLQAKGTADGIAGTFDVPAYRGSSFMDPKGRGGSTGYDFHTGLQAANDVLERQDNKTATLRHGEAVFAVSQVDVETGEVAGVFSTVQPVSDDQGNKDPTDVLTQGIWYAKLAV